MDITRDLELQKEKIFNHIANVQLRTPKKYLVQSDGSLVDITKYPDTSVSIEALEYIQEKLTMVKVRV